MTNGDKIRALPDEDFAMLIAENMLCGDCINAAKCNGSLKFGPNSCYETWLAWLKEEETT